MDKEKFKAFLEKEIARLDKAADDEDGKSDLRLKHWLRAQECYAYELLHHLEEF